MSKIFNELYTKATLQSLRAITSQPKPKPLITAKDILDKMPKPKPLDRRILNNAISRSYNLPSGGGSSIPRATGQGLNQTTTGRPTGFTKR